jgi:riboflavin biosynthesis pyrimidine reductase
MRWLDEGDEILDLIGPYAAADRSAPGGPCWVMANMVGGLDGSAAIGGRVGALSDETDRRLFRALRGLSDVVLVGAETVRRERYGPVRLPDEARAARRAQGRPETPPLAVVSRSLNLDLASPLFTEAAAASRTIVVTCATSPADRRAAAAEVADVVLAGDERVDGAKALAGLAERGASVVLCEGGPTLLGELAAADLLDELCLTLSPLLGGDPLPVAVSPPGALPTRLRRAHTLAEGDNLYLRYERTRPKEGADE